MHKLAAFVLMLCLALPALPAARKTRSPARKTSVATAKKSTTRKSASKTARKPVRPHTSIRKPSAIKPSTSVSKKTAVGKKSRRPVRKRQSWRSGQMQPAPERYKEIKQALIDKGYLSGTATGTWGTDSIAALKRFQEEQNLEPTGKIDSLSLITLGLGPKRDLSAASTAAPPRPSSSPAPRQPQ